MTKTLFSTCLVATLTIAMIAPVCAADSPWVGSWKLDESKSTLTGSTFSYAATPDGKFLFSDGSNVSYTFACDGKPYPTIGIYAIACTAAGPSEYHFSYMSNGKPNETDVDTFPADGKTMHETATANRPDGTTETTSNVYTRISGTSGLAGKWQTTKTSSDSSFAFDLTTDASGMTISIPTYKETIALKMDGTPSPITGPTVSPGSVWVVQNVGPNEFIATSELGSKALTKLDFALHPDGKTMTVSIWAPGKEKEKRVELYAKQ